MHNYYIIKATRLNRIHKKQKCTIFKILGTKGGVIQVRHTYDTHTTRIRQSFERKKVTNFKILEMSLAQYLATD